LRSLPDFASPSFGGGSIVILNSTFANNSAVEAAAIGAWGTLTVRNSTFSNNSAARPGNPSGGGAIATFPSCSGEITGATFVNNRTTGYSKGSAIVNDGTLVVSNSTFSGNHADTRGGALSIEHGTVTLTNVTLAGNTTL